MGVVLDVPNPNIGGCSCLLVTVSINFVGALLSEYYILHCSFNVDAVKILLLSSYELIPVFFSCFLGGI